MPAYPNFSFDIFYRDSVNRARTGRLTTPHGVIETPNYVFCGTKAAIKGLTVAQMREAGADIILGNAYHLMIQPGAALIEKMGGLHKFTGWNGPMLTDSGGFQVFSLGAGRNADEIKGRRTGETSSASGLLKITEEGAAFRSYVDGANLMLTPEGAIDVQRRLGADIIMQFDECSPFNVDREYTARSMQRTHRWGDRCLAEFDRGDDGRQALYGIVQGGIYPELRQEGAEYTRDRSFFGTAIGGTLGKHKENLCDVVGMTMPHVHPDRPVHLLGIGWIDDVFSGVRHGIDTFDCVSPTRIARHGWALAEGVPGNKLNLRNSRFSDDSGPLDPRCGCYACLNHSCAYIHHLLKAGEMTGLALLSLHNVSTMTRLMREIRASIPVGALDALQARWMAD